MKEGKTLRKESNVQKASESEAKSEPPQSISQSRHWSRDELSTLAKAVSKFPAGLGSRWLAVSNHMNELLKPTIPYTEQVCLSFGLCLRMLI